MKYVQFGAGLCGPVEWVNFDASPTLRLQRLPVMGRLFRKVPPCFPSSVAYGDIIRGLPLLPGCCDGIYSSHVLEHLAFSDFEKAISNVFIALRPGGIFRFVVPDMEQLAREYLSSTGSDAVHQFMRGSHLGVFARERGLLGLLRSAFGNSSHLWMWDYKAVQAALDSAGFQMVRRASIGDSGDPMFDLVEEQSRWVNCLGVHCIKPS